MTPRRIAVYVAFGLAIYAATLIATIPASWASRALERTSAQKLQLREPAGSLWAGSGRLYANQRSGPLLDLGELRWRTSWSAILDARLAIDLTLGDAPSAVQVLLSPSGTTLRGLELALPGQIVAAFSPALEGLGPQGLLRLRSADLRIDGNSILGLAELEWRQVQLARAPGLDLGSHLARLRGGGSKVDIELSTIDGPLRLSGSGTWSRDAGLSLSGAAEHDAGNAALAAFLKGVCAEYKDHRCQFRVRQ